MTETAVNKLAQLIQYVTAQQTKVSLCFDNCCFSTHQFVFIKHLGKPNTAILHVVGVMRFNSGCPFLRLRFAICFPNLSKISVSDAPVSLTISASRRCSWILTILLFSMWSEAPLKNEQSNAFSSMWLILDPFSRKLVDWFFVRLFLQNRCVSCSCYTFCQTTDMTYVLVWCHTSDKPLKEFGYWVFFNRSSHFPLGCRLWQKTPSFPVQRYRNWSVSSGSFQVLFLNSVV